MLIIIREEVTRQGFCKILWGKLRARGSLLLEFIHSSGWGGGGGGRLFEEGHLLTFSAFRMDAYSRWVLIWNWALIRINTVVRVWNGGSFAVTDNPATGTSVIFIIPNTIFFSNTTSERIFWGIQLAELWSNPVSRQEILRFPESRTNPRSQENPSRSWMISEMVSLHLKNLNSFFGFLASFFFSSRDWSWHWVVPDWNLEVLEGFNRAVGNLTQY